MRLLPISWLVGVLLATSCAPGTDTVTSSPSNGALAGAPPAPVPPSVGAAETGIYRNLFKEWNRALSDEAIQEKLESYWNSLYGTDPDRTVYYPHGENENGPMAYIKDIGNDDIRSEGMSYGMMIALQMDRKA